MILINARYLHSLAITWFSHTKTSRRVSIHVLICLVYTSSKYTVCSCSLYSPCQHSSVRALARKTASVLQGFVQYVPRRQVQCLHRWTDRQTASPVSHPFCRTEFFSVNIPASSELRITGRRRNKIWCLGYKKCQHIHRCPAKNTHAHTVSLWADSLLLSHVYVHMFIYVYVYADMCAYIFFFLSGPQVSPASLELPKT